MSRILASNLEDIAGASERDRTSDLLITNHARCGAICKRNNALSGNLRGSCPLLVHFLTGMADLPCPAQGLLEEVGIVFGAG
jgi:hypothetical protein